MSEIEKINEKEQTKIRFYVSKKEYEIIKKGAEISHKTIAAYVRECAVNQYILHINYDEIEQHTQEISEIKSAINRLIYTLVQSGNYYPADIESLIKLLNEISESEKKLIKLFQKSQPRLCKELKKIIAENMKSFSERGVEK